MLPPFAQKLERAGLLPAPVGQQQPLAYILDFAVRHMMCAQMLSSRCARRCCCRLAQACAQSSCCCVICMLLLCHSPMGHMPEAQQAERPVVPRRTVRGTPACWSFRSWRLPA